MQGSVGLPVAATVEATVLPTARGTLDTVLDLVGKLPDSLGQQPQGHAGGVQHRLFTVLVVLRQFVVSYGVPGLGCVLVCPGDIRVKTVVF
ncbi:hypothetical protein OG528_31710 [Streptomyces platensis]|uniref:hypothetical protein n=1 Tax=Streptomyces platensis TaxID=58346 RepID=UPI0030DF890D